MTHPCKPRTRERAGGGLRSELKWAGRRTRVSQLKGRQGKDFSHCPLLFCIFLAGQLMPPTSGGRSA